MKKTPLLPGICLLCAASFSVAHAVDPILITDQKINSQKILVMDYSQKDWSEKNPSAVLWSWKPGDSKMSSEGWTLPNDARLRNVAVWGGQYVVTASGYGLVAVVSYPGKVKKWFILIDKRFNVHGVELLPNGNVALAASTGGWVRIYTASQGPDSSKYVNFNLPDAHNVLWDPKRNVLWAVGMNKLVQLRIGGTDANPTLEEVSSTTFDDKYGHDLEPKLGDPNMIWITASRSIWLYNKEKNEMTKFQDLSNVKSINSQAATSQRFITRPLRSCTQNTWCTDRVEFSSPADIRVRPGAVIYRARVWSPDYQ